MTLKNHIAFVDAQILAHVADIVAMQDDSEANTRTRCLFASFTRTGLIETLKSTPDGRKVLNRYRIISS